ncbi:hypothetical protein ZIOFF_019494 [Zingiber officinale]|uniref:CRIB domain-containing protein n=1 Tax=Zingiber officinale TaxID=94328 RepID=A0A8J5H7G8_ZINOF|nr:hypothetical protein ZIOFF_019494 [Zingiber officinale]
MKKGILKPIRYISQIFDQKEPELQIGFPTDVKHVAHIGCDGPNVEDPGWMKDYHSAPINSTPGSPEKESSTSDAWGSQGKIRGTEESPAGDDSTRPRHSRRPKSDETPAISGSEVADGGTKKSRRGRKKDVAASQDAPAIPKHSHRRRPKDSGGSAVTSSKCKETPSSNPGGAAELEKTAMEPS